MRIWGPLQCHVMDLNSIEPAAACATTHLPGNCQSTMIIAKLVDYNLLVDRGLSIAHC